METVEQFLIVGLLQLGGNSGDLALWETVGCVGSWGWSVMARESIWEQNGLTPLVNIMHFLLARQHLTSQVLWAAT